VQDPSDGARISFVHGRSHSATTPEEGQLSRPTLFEHYHRLVKLTDPEIVQYPARELVQSSRHLIRHAADVPVLLSAMASKPDWLLTHNTRHFTQSVAKRSGLRIATPAEFFRTLSSLLR